MTPVTVIFQTIAPILAAITNVFPPVAYVLEPIREKPGPRARDARLLRQHG